jgi:hypothetical protein
LVSTACQFNVRKKIARLYRIESVGGWRDEDENRLVCRGSVLVKMYQKVEYDDEVYYHQ